MSAIRLCYNSLPPQAGILWAAYPPPIPLTLAVAVAAAWAAAWTEPEPPEHTWATAYSRRRGSEGILITHAFAWYFQATPGPRPTVGSEATRAHRILMHAIQILMHAIQSRAHLGHSRQQNRNKGILQNCMHACRKHNLRHCGLIRQQQRRRRRMQSRQSMHLS